MEVTAFLNTWILLLDLAILICISFTIQGKEWFLFTHRTQQQQTTIIGVGLWEKCSQGAVKNTHWCNELHTDLRWLDISRSLVISSCVLSVLCILLTIATYWRAIFEKIGMLVTFALVCIMSTALSSFYKHHKSMLPDDKELQYGWTFHVGIASILIASVAFVFQLCMCVYVRGKQVKTVKYRVQKNTVDI